MKKLFFRKITLIVMAIFAFVSMPMMAVERLNVAEVQKVSVDPNVHESLKVASIAKLTLLNVDTEAINSLTSRRLKAVKMSKFLTTMTTKEAVKQNTNFEVRQS